MKLTRPWFHRLEVPLQTTGQECHITLPYDTAWVMIGDETGIAKGYVVSNIPGALKFGTYWFTDQQRGFRGPWYGRDMYFAAKTIGQLTLNITAFPLFWLAQEPTVIEAIGKVRP